MEDLINKKRPLTDKKWDEIIDYRSGMEFRYTWNPVDKRFSYYYGTGFILTNNTIIIFFKHSRLALRLGESEFIGDTPMFPSTWLRDCLKLRYRCTLTHKILYGAKIIETELPIDSFQIPQENGEFRSLLDILRNEYDN